MLTFIICKDNHEWFDKRIPQNHIDCIEVIRVYIFKIQIFIFAIIFLLIYVLHIIFTWFQVLNCSVIWIFFLGIFECGNTFFEKSYFPGSFPRKYNRITLTNIKSLLILILKYVWLIFYSIVLKNYRFATLTLLLYFYNLVLLIGARKIISINNFIAILFRKFLL